MKEINIIVATSTKYGIGYENKMCWNIPEELQNFRNITTSVADKNKMNCVIMGRNTWKSLPNGALKNRLNVVLSKTLTNDIGNTESVIVKQNIQDAFEYIEQDDNIENAFIIGGAQLYNEVLENQIHRINKIYLSIIYDKDYRCDRFVDSQKIYKNFHFDKENIHFTEKYVYMIGHNKHKQTTDVVDEPPL